MSEILGKCPECKNPSALKYRPFCSKRCADIDLGRWLTGGYVVAGGNSDADEDGEAPDFGPVSRDAAGSGGD